MSCASGLREERELGRELAMKIASLFSSHKVKSNDGSKS